MDSSAVFSASMGDKSLDKALDIKLKGNEFYKKNEFEKAIELYTEAINACPPHRYTMRLSILSTILG